MTEPKTDNILHQFVDGECSPSEELSILRAEEDDAELARRIRKIRKRKAELRAAMDLELLDEVPGDLIQATGTIAADNMNRAPEFSIGAKSAIFLVACLFGAVALGTAWSHWRINDWQNTMASLEEKRETAVTLAVQEGLETYLSGDALEINDQNLGIAVSVRPDETYRSVSGHWCRGFTETMTIDGQEIRRKAVACRDQDTHTWMRMHTVIEGSILDQTVHAGI
ncbi:MAG: DVU3141 family protein [Pseudomonadota bacterium]